MFCYIKLNEEQIAAIEAEIKAFYCSKYGQIPVSLTHAVALESFASKMRESLATQEAERARMLSNESQPS